jgi:hypothetical protein
MNNVEEDRGEWNGMEWNGIEYGGHRLALSPKQSKSLSGLFRPFLINFHRKGLSKKLQ